MREHHPTTTAASSTNTVLMYSPQGGTTSKRKVFGRGGRRLCPVHGRGGVEGNALDGSAEHLTLRRDHR
eukprot:scaffold12455_cov62-Phaeocystis_antarctica.AAC.2